MITYFDILNWEPVPGYPIKNFNWFIFLYVIGAVALIFTVFYFLYVFYFTKKKMTRAEEKEANDKIKKIKKLKKQEKKDQISKLSNSEKRLRTWKKMRVPLITCLSVGVIVGSTAGAVLPIVWEPLMQALNKKTAGGSNDSEAAQLAIGESKENIVTLEKEGIVLLKNHDNVLPLNKEVNNKINIFGSSAFGMLYGGGGSGVFVTNHFYNGNDFRAKRLEAALKDEGFEYNTNLYNLVANYYESSTYKITPTNYNISCQFNMFVGNTTDSDGTILVDSTCFPYDHEPEVSAYTKTYDGLGGKTLLEAAKEYSDTALFCVSRAGSEDADLNRALTQLTSRELAMVKMLEENFEKVIFIVNSSNPMELGELENDKVDSVLWVGHPGLTGNSAVAKVIAGECSPSGKTADTWVYDNSSAPAFQSFGPDTTVYSDALGKSIVEYLEGIYVGYRYYTTRAHTDTTFKYDDYVQYSFGHGLSYTTFSKKIIDSIVDLENHKVSVRVEVKNTGEVAGKEVIELYLTAPYTPGGIEKAYVELAAFDKTNELQPGETYTKTLEIDLESLASWDTKNEYYVLEAGDYEISLRDNAWDITEVQAGETNKVTFKYDITVKFKKSKGGADYKAQFAAAEKGPHDSKLVYLSRNDWEGTMPSEDAIHSRRNNIASGVKVEKRNFSDGKLTGNSTLGAKNGLKFRDLKDADFDDPRWDKLIEQMSEKDLKNLVSNGGFQTAEIKSISKRATYDDDGPASIQIKGTGFVGEVVIASSWNTNAADLMGRSIGKEGAAMGLSGWYAPGLNIHRCATGGRNFEYYSEDPLLSGMMGGYTAQGAAFYGVYTYAKHIALNDQETARQNLTVWANEQSIRQIYLRAFEVYCREGGKGFMSSFSRIGTLWTGEHGFINNICRDEWGWHGVTITDWINPSLMPIDGGLRGGNDLWLFNNPTYSADDVMRYTPKDGILLLKRAAKNILYVVANSNGIWTEEEFHEKGVDVDFSQMGYTNY